MATSPNVQRVPGAEGVEALHALVMNSLDDDQAVETVSIPLAGKSSIADYMVVASGRSTRQVASMAQKLAERGGSNQELKALFGWNSDAMASLYTRKADRRRMALAAAEKLNENDPSPHLSEGVAESQNSDGNSDA